MNRVFIGSLILCSSCAFFVSDAIDPRLPRYSENGSNVAGAVLSDGVWNSKGFSRTMFEIYPDRDSIIFEMRGIAENDNRSLDVSFVWVSDDIETAEDLLLLSDKVIDVSDGLRVVSAKLQQWCLFEPNGQIHFRNVRMTESNSFVISGSFGFDRSEDCFFENEMTFGRFDFELLENDNVLIYNE